MLKAALASDHGRDDSIRVARIILKLELGEAEAHDLARAILSVIRGRVVDIFGLEAWEEASRPDPPDEAR